jgi:hypothetical protein
MTTTLKCGEYRCTQYKSAVESYVDDRSWPERNDPKSSPKATLRNLRCRFHVGVNKRAKYSGRTVLPLTDEDRTRLLAEQAAIDAKEAREAEERRKAGAIRREQQRREDWAELNLPAGHALNEETDRSLTAREEPVFTGQVWLGEEKPTERYDNRWLQVEPTHRHYSAAPKGEEYPYVIRIMRGSNLTPNQARALAALLIESADKAEELNAGKEPR